jgi:hypothetical protein
MSELLLHVANFGNFRGNIRNRIVEDYMKFLGNKLGIGIVLNKFAGARSLSKASGTCRIKKNDDKVDGIDIDLHGEWCLSLLLKRDLVDTFFEFVYMKGFSFFAVLGHRLFLCRLIKKLSDGQDTSLSVVRPAITYCSGNGMDLRSFTVALDVGYPLMIIRDSKVSRI